MEKEIEEIPDAEIDSILDWYDQALASGQGFKSEAERQAYFDELGDPLMHPLWAESMEDLEGNPMVEAFRLLREEDKTKVELVLMYKDEGNEFMRKKTKKERHEAIKRYSHALTLLDAADAARRDGTEDEADRSVNLRHLRALIFNNRAMALMQLKNNGLALKDLTMALLYHPENIKAHYRKSRVLFLLKRPELALKASEAGLAVLSSAEGDKDQDSSERELLALRDQCVSEIERLRRLREAAAQVQRAKEVLWRQAWQIAQARGVRIGHMPKHWRPPPQLTTHMPHCPSPTDPSEEAWPLVVLYPQYSQLDVIQAASAETMLVLLLAEMFPEDEGHGAPAVSWDPKREYRVSNLRVFIQLNTTTACSTEEDWVSSLRLRDTESGEATENSQSQAFNPDYHMELMEIHLGCTIQQILTAPGHILVGGTLSLTVYPNNSEALAKFLKKFDGRCQFLQPTGAVAAQKK